MTTEQRKEVSEIDELLEILLSAKDDGNGNIQERVEARQAIQGILAREYRNGYAAGNATKNYRKKVGQEYLDDIKDEIKKEILLELQQSLKQSKERSERWYL